MKLNHFVGAGLWLGTVSICVWLNGCDSDDQTKIYPYPAPGPAAPHTTPVPSTPPGGSPTPVGSKPPTGDTFSLTQAPLTAKWCASCHNGEAFLTSGAAFVKTNGGKGPQERVGNKSMPLAGSQAAANMPDADRKTLTDYRVP